MNFREGVSLIFGVTIPALLAVISTIANTANADSAIATITVDKGPYGAVFDPDNGYIYTANVAAGSVSVIDGKTNKVIDTITEPAGQTPRELAFNSDNGYYSITTLRACIKHCLRENFNARSLTVNGSGTRWVHFLRKLNIFSPSSGKCSL